MKSKHIPAIKLTKISALIFNPVPIGSFLSNLLKMLTVIGIVHANGISNQPNATQPRIKKTFITILIALFSLFLLNDNPQLKQALPSLLTSAPHWGQNTIITSSLPFLCLRNCNIQKYKLLSQSISSLLHYVNLIYHFDNVISCRLF